MKNLGLPFLLLGALSVLLLSLPWLVPHLGVLALVAFVPLLIMDMMASAFKVKGFFWFYFSVFLLWNVCTTFWVCNATVGGGIFAALANALQMSFVFFLFRLSKKKFKGVLPYIFLVVAWIAWERYYLNGQISWPWLTLGNAFARTTSLVQWYEFTGSLGGSLWIWISNLLVFSLTVGIMGGFSEMKLPSRILVAIFAPVAVAAPIVWSRHIYNNYETPAGESVKVIIGQPNFDPYHKFESMTQEQQNAVLLKQFRQELAVYDTTTLRPTLLMGPETFTSDIVLNFMDQGRSWNEYKSFLSPYKNVNFLFGASTYYYYQQASRPSDTSRKIRDGLWMQAYNSALLMDRTGRTDVFHKSKLVVGTELTPYPAFFTKIDDKLGGVMGRCIGQDEISNLNLMTYDSSGEVLRSTPFGCAVCYESVYGEYCTGYVKKGAKFLTVITNDAWWGDTPGYKQHLSYSCLRAIELRRDIARCGNTGISAFINQRGDIVSESEWWKAQTLRGYIQLNDTQTAFVRYGDVVGRICFLISSLLTLLLMVVSFVSRRREDD